MSNHIEEILTNLELKAEAATPGPWKLDINRVDDYADMMSGTTVVARLCDSAAVCNMSYIASVCPYPIYFDTAKKCSGWTPLGQLSPEDCSVAAWQYCVFGSPRDYLHPKCATNKVACWVHAFRQLVEEQK